MAQYDQWNQPGQNSYNFDVPDQFGQQLDFQSFDTQAPGNYNDQVPAGGAYSGSQFYNPNAAPAYSGEFFTPAAVPTDPGKGYATSSGNEFDDEPPLLEELGINPNHILQKTLSVLNPFRATDQAILQDTDLAGPLVFVLAFGAFLLLRGKVTFSYIYGIGVMGCLAFYCLLSLMASQAKVTLGAVISVLGYCLLPMVVLSGINILISVSGTAGLVLSAVCILWCAVSSSKLFVTAYAMDHQQVLVAYPCAIFYGIFALISIF